MENFKGKKVKLIFDDKNGPTPKVGIIEDSDDKYIYIKQSGRNQEAIPHSRVLRLELLKGGSG